MCAWLYFGDGNALAQACRLLYGLLSADGGMDAYLKGKVQ